MLKCRFVRNAIDLRIEKKLGDIREAERLLNQARQKLIVSDNEQG